LDVGSLQMARSPGHLHFFPAACIRGKWTGDGGLQRFGRQSRPEQAHQIRFTSGSQLSCSNFDGEVHAFPMSGVWPVERESDTSPFGKRIGRQIGSMYPQSCILRPRPVDAREIDLVKNAVTQGEPDRALAAKRSTDRRLGAGSPARFDPWPAGRITIRFIHSCSSKEILCSHGGWMDEAEPYSGRMIICGRPSGRLKIYFHL
jgi:hypothetical protein